MSSTSNLSTYIGYFRGLAVKHKDLLHDPTSETPDGVPENKHFTRWGIEEAISGIAGTIGYPCLMLEIYEVLTQSEVVYDIKSNPSGAFSIIDHVEDKDNVQQQEEALLKTEKILYEILSKIYYDHYGADSDKTLKPFQDFNFDQLNIMSVGPIMSGNEYGWRCQFHFKQRLNTNITTPPAAGTFIV